MKFLHLITRRLALGRKRMRKIIMVVRKGEYAGVKKEIFLLIQRMAVLVDGVEGASNSM